MDDDVKIKLIYTVGLTTIYAILFYRIPLDMAVVVTLVTTFTNALTGVITYNIGKRQAQKRR